MNITCSFPYKVELRNPNEVVFWEEVADPELINYVPEHAVNWYKPGTKVFKKSIVNLWCNMVFSPRNWDFEADFNEDHECIGYRLCFLKEEHATFFSLRWL